MLKVVVDRKTWHRGKPGARLLTNKGERCCLGFVCTQLGIEDRLQLNARNPWEVFARVGTSLTDEKKEALKKVFLDTCRDVAGEGIFEEDFIHNETTGNMVSVNDDLDMTEEQREVELIRLARQIDIELSFA